MVLRSLTISSLSSYKSIGYLFPLCRLSFIHSYSLHEDWRYLITDCIGLLYVSTSLASSIWLHLHLYVQFILHYFNFNSELFIFFKADSINFNLTLLTYITFIAYQRLAGTSFWFPTSFYLNWLLPRSLNMVIKIQKTQKQK